MQNSSVARLEQIRDYLIYLHVLIKLDKEGKVVLIYLDGLYCNTTQSNTHSWNLSAGNPIKNSSTSRFRCLISIHAITKYGPLCDFDVIKGRPIEKIKCKGDTPHIDSPDIKTINEADSPLPLTSELIWISGSHTGDYHDNMNDNMFMKFITTKFIPLASHNYTGV